jgi:hypothetical protein
MSASETLYKVLDDTGACHHGGQGRWHLPSADAPGEWMPAIHGALEPCRRGYHLCRETDLINWLGPAIFIAEYDGDRVEVNDANEGKVVVRRARLLSRVSNWDAQSARLFACDCAERALLRESERGREPDPRCWESIAVARRFVRGEATQVELTAARAAAGACSLGRSRGCSLGRSRGRSQGRSQGRSLGRSHAAWGVAWAAARDAARTQPGPQPGTQSVHGKRGDFGGIWPGSRLSCNHERHPPAHRPR